jgi:hypothetical protein
MRRTYWLLALAGLLGLAAAHRLQAAPAPSTKSALAQLPGGSPIVVHLRGAEGTRDRFVALLKAALPDLVPLVQPKLDEWIKDGVQGRKLRGVPKDGPIFLFFTDMPRGNQNPPHLGILAKTTKYEEFRDNLLNDDERKEVKDNGKGVERGTLENEPVYFVNLSGWALMTPSEEVADLFTKKLDNTLDSRVSKPLADKLLASDLGVYLAVDLFNKHFADEIKEAREQAIKQIKEGAERTDLPAGTGQLLPLIQKSVEAIFQTVEDSKAFLFTVELRKAGAAIHAQTEIRPGTPTAKLFADVRPQPFEQMDQLPAARQGYTALDGGPTLMRALGELMFGVMADAGKDSSEAKAVKAAVDNLIKAGPGQLIEANGIPPGGLQVWSYEDSDKAVAAQLRLLEALPAGSTYQSGILKKKAAVKRDDQKYDGMALHRVDLVWDLDKLADKAGGGKELADDQRKQIIKGLKRLRGEGVTCWLGSNGKAVYQVTARDWDGARKLLDEYKKGSNRIGDAPAYQAIRKELPRRASYVGVLDLTRYLVPLFEVVRPMLSMLPIPLQIPEDYPAEPGQGTAGYLAVAATLESRALSVDLILSNEAISEIYKSFARPFLKGNAN